MHRLFILLITLFFAIGADAEVLKIGRSVSDRMGGAAPLRGIAETVLSNMNDQTYTGYELYTQQYQSLDEFIELAKARQMDIVVESLFSAAEIARRTDLEPVLLISRNGSVFINGIVITRQDSEAGQLSDLIGKVVAVPDENSTSAYHLLKKSLRDSGIPLVRAESANAKPPKGTVGYFVAGGNKQAVNHVYLKKTEAASICDTTWIDENFVPDFTKDNLKVIYETNSVPGLYLLIRRSMPQEQRDNIIHTLLNIHKSAKNIGSLDNCKITSFHKISFDWGELLRTLSD